jgi:hypothetical protein
MIRCVVTGGQTGADQAGWRAMTMGFMTEDGPRPEFAKLYGAHDINSEDYRDRTEANVNESDLVLWFGKWSSSGGKCTIRCARRRGVPFYPAEMNPTDNEIQRYAEDIRIILDESPGILMVAGNRESTTPGIGQATEMVLLKLFRERLTLGRN